HIERLLDGTLVEDAQITLTGGGTVPVSNDVLAVWDPSNLPADHYRIVLTVELQNGSTSTDSNFIVMDPALHEGWPRVLDSNQLGVPLFEHTVLADVDGDGLPEHIVGYGNLVNALKHDGSQAAGWPQNVAPNNESLGLVFEAPAVGDVDGDGAPEVVAATLDGRIWVWEGDGVLKAGWPQQRNEFDRNNVTLADVDGDDTLEIVLAEDEDGLDVI